MVKSKSVLGAVSMMIILFALPALAVENTSRNSEAIATAVEGTADTISKTSPAGSALKRGDSIKKDQTVRVGDKSRVEIRFPDGTVMRLSERSRLVMNEVAYDTRTEGKNVKVNLSVGKLWAKVRKLITPDSTVEVKTGNAVAGVRGTVYRVNVEDDKSSLIKVYDGSVYVANPPKDPAGRPPTQFSRPTEVAGPHAVAPPVHEVSMEEWTVIVKAMQQITVSPQGVASKPQDFDSKSDSDEWVRWNQERDRQTQE